MKALYFLFFSLLLAVPLGALTYTGDACQATSPRDVLHGDRLLLGLRLFLPVKAALK
jgi:hypothetical protein